MVTSVHYNGVRTFWLVGREGSLQNRRRYTMIHVALIKWKSHFLAEERVHLYRKALAIIFYFYAIMRG
jgi:hypothetical protein